MINKLSLQVNSGGLNPQTTGRRTYAARFARAGSVRMAGNTLSNIVIEPAALVKASEGGLFEARPVFVNHAGLWEYPSINNLVGVTRAASWDDAEQVVSGEIKLYDVPLARSIAALLDQMLAEPDPPDVGLSMVFYPEWDTPPPSGDEGREGLQRITGISHIESIDLVFEPAADGRILHALSGHHTSGSERSEGPAKHNQKVVKSTTQGDPHMSNLKCEDLVEGNPSGQPGAATTRVDNTPESLAIHDPQSTHYNSKKPNEATVESPSPYPQPHGSSVAFSDLQSASSHDIWLDALGKSTSEAMIQASALPEAAKEHLCLRTYTAPGQVEQAIQEQRAYLARLQEDNIIDLGGKPPRGSSISGMRTSLDQLQIALDALLEGVRPRDGIQPLTGVRELYMLLSGDYEMTGVFHPERIQFANVTTSTMANLTADALNKRLMAEFQQYPQWWGPVVNIEDFATLQDVKWIVLGGIGELPTVSEGAAYTELSWDDQKETSAFVKKGGYLGITIEAIDKDDTGRLRAAPRALAQAAWLTLSKAISEIFTSNSGVGPTMSDSLALFHTTHGNLGTAALSVSSWSAARVAMRKMTELNSGERLGALTAPRYLLVPPDLEITALQVLASEYDYSYALSNGVAAPANAFAEGDTLTARMNFARSRVVVVDLWTDTNNWAATADPNLYPTIGLGFRYGRVPEVFSVASPTAGLMFTNDTMPVKVRFFFATGPVDYRGLYKGNVA